MAAAGARRRKVGLALSVLTMLVTLVVVGWAAPAGAACAAGYTPDAEFIGTAVAVDGGNVEYEQAGQTHTRSADARTTFAVEEWIVGGGPSGGPSEVVAIANGASGNGSGFQMMGDDRPVVVLGERWRVAAYEGDPADDALDAACGGSTRLAAAPWPSADPPEQGSLLALRTILAAIIAFGAAAWLVTRVRRRRGTRQPDAPAPTP